MSSDRLNRNLFQIPLGEMLSQADDRDMAKLKIEALPDDKPVKISLELPASVHRDLLAYAEAVSAQSGQPVSDAAKLIVPMILRFMATDRAFSKPDEGIDFKNIELAERPCSDSNKYIRLGTQN